MKLSVEQVIQLYQDDLYRLAFSICRNHDDALDALQETFIKYYKLSLDFNDEQHLKKWLFRVVINQAKDIKRLLFRHNNVSYEDYIQGIEDATLKDQTLLLSVLNLPEKYRIVLHLYYYEDYSTKEIAEILHLTLSNTKQRLNRAKKKLKEEIENERRL